MRVPKVLVAPLCILALLVFTTFLHEAFVDEGCRGKRSFRRDPKAYVTYGVLFFAAYFAFRTCKGTSRRLDHLLLGTGVVFAATTMCRVMDCDKKKPGQRGFSLLAPFRFGRRMHANFSDDTPHM
jgi:hypothetical protein